MKAPFTYRAAQPNGKVTTFTSVAAFDGYVAAWRIAGYFVSFSSPFDCQVQGKK